MNRANGALLREDAGGRFGERRKRRGAGRDFLEYGDERESRRFARAVVHDRALRKFETTRQLAELIERLSPRAGR